MHYTPTPHPHPPQKISPKQMQNKKQYTPPKNKQTKKSTNKNTQNQNLLEYFPYTCSGMWTFQIFFYK